MRCCRAGFVGVVLLVVALADVDLTSPLEVSDQSLTTDGTLAYREELRACGLPGVRCRHGR
jgi:hypothetical protein